MSNKSIEATTSRSAFGQIAKLVIFPALVTQSPRCPEIPDFPLLNTIRNRELLQNPRFFLVLAGLGGKWEKRSKTRNALPEPKTCINRA